MALQSITNINVDFYDKKYILINAKQYDKNSRFLSVTCYNHGEICSINPDEHSAYIRYRKADNNSVFNFCEINNNGKILVELTEQMLASDGICYADLVVVNKGNAIIDSDTGKIINIENASVLSTMTFCINVSESAIENSDIESSYEINLINETLEKYEADYSNVVQTARSWAVGGTGIRDGEAENNSKYWAEVAAQNATGQVIVVTSIKGDNETSYRSGQVNITADNVGAVSTNDVATIDEVKEYLGIE